MKIQSRFKKFAINGVISGKYCTFALTNHNCDAQMRLLFLFLTFLVTAFTAPARGQAQNVPGSSIVSRTLLSSDGSTKVGQRVYDNGLGDIVQEIQFYPGSTLSNVVVHHEYDEYRRRTKSWLPVISSDSLFVSGGTIANQAQSQYSDTAPFSRTVYDGFLQSQPSAQYKAGAQWQNNGKKVTSAYSEYVETGMFAPEEGYFYTYPDVKFLRTTTYDEDSCLHIEYTDLNGRVMISETSQGKTYYLYNPKGDITHVIPPILSEYIISQYGSYSPEIPDNEEMMQKYAYIYRYDNQRHCILKKLPGCDSVYYVYDRTGACILTQDGNLRQSGRWAFTIPDKFGRPCISGICKFTGSYAAEPLHPYHVYAEYDGSSAATGGYTIHNLTADSLTLYSATYYDGYSFIGSHGVPASLTASSVTGFPVDASVGHGMQTGSATAILRDGAVTGYTYSAMYYDSRYNVAQVKATNHFGGTETTCTTYTYTGKPENVRIQHTSNKTGTLTENYTYTYDGADRVSTRTLSVANGVPPLTSTFTYAYDALGRLSNVSRPFTSATPSNVAYTYDLHGWMTGITTCSFQETLYYADGPGTPRYNGNISCMRWWNDDYARERGYKFTYDTANRLTQAAYGEGNALTSYANRFSEGVGYDANGNVTSITRRGKVSSNTYGIMDNLTLTYDGNHLTGVTETAADYDVSGSFEYKRAKGSQYMYDRNGNLIADRSRGIAYITYDSNGNPGRIYFTNGNETRYVYSATGQKLRVTHYVAMPNITRPFGVKPEGTNQSQMMFSGQKDYLLGGSLVLQEEDIDKVLFDGGYFKATLINSTRYGFTAYYYNQDHLGNNREVVNASGNVQQVTNYYPFGAPYADPEAVMNAYLQPYKYNGKELDTMHGLNTYDYGARQYNPILCRWDRVDPLCEKYYSISPYVYCENDPVNAFDPDGKSGWKVLLKGAYKVGKTVAKNGLSSLTKSATYATAFNDVVEDTKTLFDSNASTLDRTVAGVSLLSEIVSPVSVKDAENIGKATKGLTKDFSKIGSTGKVGEEALKKLGGESQKTFKTSQGTRRVDQFSKGVAHESKVGYQSSTNRIKTQIQKDAELIKTKKISGATWHFYQSPVTGKGGPSKPLMDELKKNDIKVEIHE